MTQDQIIKLSEKVAGLYLIPAYKFNDFSNTRPKAIWLAEDSAQLFELAVNFDIDILNGKDNSGIDYRQAFCIRENKPNVNILEITENYTSKLQATCVAICKCLIALKESV